MAILSANEQLW